MRLFQVAIVGLLSSALWAQPVRVAGVISGFVFDARAGVLRPIYGVPGAAYVGEALLEGVTWASVAPDGRAALVSREGVLAAVTDLVSFQPAWRAVENVAIKPDRAVWSEDGSFALIYSSGAGAAQLIRTSQGDWAAGELLPLGTELGALAVDPQGGVIAGLAEGLYLFAPGQAPVVLARLPRATALAIWRGRVFAAGADGELVEIQDYAWQPKALSWGTVGDVAGLAVASDGRSLFLARPEERVIEVYDLASRTSSLRLPVEAEPAGLEQLTSGGIWLITSPARPSEPLYVLKTSEQPGVWFVPVGKGE